MIWLGQKYKNIIVCFLVQMKTSKFSFEINWPLRLEWSAVGIAEVSPKNFVYFQ